MSRFRPLIFAVLAIASLPAEGWAAPITGFVQGTITMGQSQADNPGGRVYDFTPGELFALTYTFADTGAGPPSEFNGLYGYLVPPARFALITSGGYAGSGRSFGLLGCDASLRDGTFDLFRLAIGGDLGYVEVTFRDDAGLCLTSTALPSLAEILHFTVASVYFSSESSRGVETFRGSGAPVAALSSPVPEPSAFVTGAIGLVACVAFARRLR
jgi:hypothetical protein